MNQSPNASPLSPSESLARLHETDPVAYAAAMISWARWNAHLLAHGRAPGEAETEQSKKKADPALAASVIRKSDESLQVARRELERLVEHDPSINVDQAVALWRESDQLLKEYPAQSKTGLRAPSL